MPLSFHNVAENNPQAQALFVRRIVPGVVALLALALVAAAALVTQIATSIDRDTLDRERLLANQALDAQRHWMSRSIADYAFWGDAYRNLNGQTNLDWAYEQANLGPSLYEDFGYEAVFIINPKGETTYSVMRGELRTLDAHQWLQGGLDQLLVQARDALANDMGTVGLLSAEGYPAMVAAAVLTTGYSNVEAAPGPASILLFVDVLDPGRLVALGDKYALEAFQVVPTPSKPPGLERFMSDGTPIHFAWSFTQPGRYLLWMTLPLLGAVTLGLGLLAWLLLRQAMRIVQTMDDNYARLADSRAALAASEERFRVVAEAASDWIWETDQDARLSYLSNRFEDITGHQPDAWLGRPLIELLIIDSAALMDWLASPHDAPLRCSFHAADGRERHCRLSARPILLDGVPVGYRGTASDITEETKSQAHIHYLSQHDALTGLPNRNRMREHLETRLTSGTSNLTLLYIDLDRFKPVNDTFGHAAGDEVLKEVSNRLKQCVRDDDLVARLGGDEFVIVLSRLRSTEDMDKLCTRIISSLSAAIVHEQTKIFIGASIGIAVAPADAQQANELLRCADMALYQAKAAGRATWRFYDSEADQRLHARRRLEDELHNAIIEEQFVLHYQPRYLGEDLRINGAEALVRWQHPQRGLLLPDSIIPLAEETGLIITLGRWVIRQACLEASGWNNDQVVSVNLSPLQLKNDNLVSEIREALQESGLPASRLELEITESALLQQNENTLGLLHRLKALGLRLAMDDFGTGYSSLSNLRNYPFDVIKIDGSFVAGIPQSSEDHSIVRALIDLGRGLRMSVTAEGVETALQLESLLDDGCTEVQGFHMSHPMPAATLRELMSYRSNDTPADPLQE